MHLTLHMIIKWAKGRVMQITTSFKFLNFTAVLTQSKGHLLNGIDRKCTFENQISNSISISAQGFLRTNTDSWVKSTILILLALDIRIFYEWLFQNLRLKYVIKFVEWNLSDGRSAHEHILSKYIIEDVLKKSLIPSTSTGYRLRSIVYLNSIRQIPR